MTSTIKIGYYRWFASNISTKWPKNVLFLDLIDFLYSPDINNLENKTIQPQYDSNLFFGKILPSSSLIHLSTIKNAQRKKKQFQYWGHLKPQKSIFAFFDVLPVFYGRSSKHFLDPFFEKFHPLFDSIAYFRKLCTIS